MLILTLMRNFTRRLWDAWRRRRNAIRAAALAQAETREAQAEVARLNRQRKTLERTAKELRELMATEREERAADQRSAEDARLDLERQVESLEHRNAIQEREIELLAAVHERNRELYLTETALLSAARTRVLEAGAMGPLLEDAE